ncbi:hypothetical protein MAPG_00771 [Magnaporthiopsis poae ATCC 64411]|uniref:P-loop containing nucleoside triphosphate hydrolase protein n=1 Tax=Magnaporthiopsis poae (strain ATCC 64411 / 73-15) TaxID=644358 RepID=A0A0C4DLX2_MAGP6|nr:hypothetical protein MAPG_00771 [Magnaporthiopsis poae ATCC 64411]
MEEHTITILLLGDENVGKSTFLSRVSQGMDRLHGRADITLLRDSDQPFIFELRSRKGLYRIELHDTSGPHDWHILRPDVIVICYDISQRLSLINMQRVWIKEVRSTFPEGDSLPILVLGLKRDLRSEDDPNGIIYPQEAYRIAQEMRADKYAECSAVTGELLSEAFEDVYKTAVKTTTDQGGQSEGGCVVM